jgi:flagellar biosynthesis protein FliP
MKLLQLIRPLMSAAVRLVPCLVLLVASPLALAQLGPVDAVRPLSPDPIAMPGVTDSGDGINPVSMLAAAAEAMPGSQNGSTTSNGSKRGLSTAVNIVVVLTVIGLVPSIMLMCTCFVRIVIVLGLLKQALGAAQMPPSQVMLGLSLIMTMLVMAPTIDRIHAEAVVPYQKGEVNDYEKLWNLGKQPLRDFMFAQIEHSRNWSSLYMIMNYRGIDISKSENLTRANVDMLTLIPAFVLSELKVAFLMGFRVYLPFLVIDMVISALLISMSMMMLPPVLISLPFKLLLFVLVDGWQLVCGSLMQSFVTERAPTIAYAEQLWHLGAADVLAAAVNITPALSFV